MDYAVRWGGFPQDILIEAHGEATPDEIKSLITAVMADSRYHPGVKVLLDQSRLQATSLTSDDMLDLAAFVVDRREQVGDTAIAIATPNQREYGLSRTWRTYAQPLLGNLVGIFYTRTAAEEWLARIPQPTQRR
jgi:predicted transcriptional regulator